MDAVALKLRVISDHYRRLGKRSSRLFGVHGGRIGRAANNDLVLPDPERYVSSHHAKVTFNAGTWLLEDTSTNGVFLNGADTPLSVEGPYQLQDGDRLRVGDYELLVSIDERNDFPPDASGQLPAPGTHLNSALDISALLVGDVTQPVTAHERAPPAGSTNSQPPALSLLDAGEGRPAAADAAVSGGPAPEWHMATRQMERRKRPAAAAPPDAGLDPRPQDGLRELDAGVEAFCRGIGIDAATLSTETQAAMLTLAGQMLREVVLSLMDLLKARADLKHRLRLGQTTIQPSENNPLKFSASVDEAVRKLLDAHNTRYLGPIEALRDTFNDLKMHQVATHNAMQSALETLLEHLDPTELQERFDRGLKRGALLGAANKIKYWDLYNEFYQVLNQRDEQGLPPVFAEEYARAYAEKATDPKVNRRRS